MSHNSHGQNDECRINSQQKMSKRDLKSTSGESLSSQAEYFISEIYKPFPYGISQCGSIISKTSKVS